MTKIIKKVTIQPVESPLGNMGARVVLEDKDSSETEEGYLFSWFNNKIHFDESELLGLTVLEAHRLRHRKNSAVKLYPEIRPS